MRVIGALAAGRGGGLQLLSVVVAEEGFGLSVELFGGEIGGWLVGWLAGMFFRRG